LAGLLTINDLELGASVTSIAMLLDQLGESESRHLAIRNFLDNSSACSWWAKSGAKPMIAALLMEELAKILVHYQVNLSCKFIQGILNVAADALSRQFMENKAAITQTELTQVVSSFTSVRSADVVFLPEQGRVSRLWDILRKDCRARWTRQKSQRPS